MFTKEIYTQRRNALKGAMSTGIILLPGNGESPRNYPDNVDHFRQDSTFLYYFGLNGANLVGVLDLDTNTDTLYGDDYTIDDIIWMGDQPAIIDLAHSTGVAHSAPLSVLHERLKKAIAQGRKIHFLPPYRTATLLQLRKLLGIAMTSLPSYASSELVHAVVSAREIKSSEEIEELDRAFNIGYEMHTLAMRLCRPGISEREIAGAIEGIALQQGAGVSFHNIVTHNGQTLHNHSHHNLLDPQRMLLVDAGAETVRNYCSDNTRTMPVTGSFTARQRDLYTLLTAAFETSLSLIRPDITYQSVHRSCAEVLTEGLHQLGLIKGNVQNAVDCGAFALFMPHGLGHQLGMDVHDMENVGENNVGYDAETTRSTLPGFSSLRMGKRLKTGHVVSVEPGLYFIPKLVEKWQKENINKEFINFERVGEYLNVGGMRVEDTIVVLKQGARTLGERRIPYTVTAIEEFMKGNF